MSSIYSTDIKVPQGIDLDTITLEFLKTSSLRVSKQRAKDTFALVIHHLRIKHSKKVTKGKISNTGFAPFHVNHRRELFGKNEKMYFKYLEEKKYLLTRGYKINVKSTGYKLTNEFKERPWVDYRITDKIMVERINQLKEKSCDLTRILNIKSSATQKALQLPAVTLHPSVFAELSKMKEAELNSTTDTEELLNIEDKFDEAEDNIRSINSGDYSEKVDRMGNRLHTRMVRLMKELRPFVLINGQPVVEVDIKNSQPFFMQVLAQRQLWDSMKIQLHKLHISDLDHNMVLKLKEQSDYFQEVMVAVTGKKLLSTSAKTKSRRIGVRGTEVAGVREEVEAVPGKREGSILLLAVLVTETDEPSGLNFLSLSSKGTLYDVLYQVHSNKYFDDKGNDLLKDRNTAKSTIMNELFGDPRKIQYKGYKTILESLFPNFFLFTKLLKETGYINLALLLQRAEAKIFLEGAVESFLKANPGSVLVTVHDSVLVPYTLTAVVKKHVEDYVEQHVGSRPICTMKDSHLLEDHIPFAGVTADSVGQKYSL